MLWLYKTIITITTIQKHGMQLEQFEKNIF